jgi:hypothetical protein
VTEASVEPRAGTGRKPLGVLRKFAGMLSYSFAAIGAALTIAGFVYAQGFRMRHADTGDFTGAALLESFFIFDVVPLSLIALTAAIWLFPPNRWRRGHAGRVESPSSPAATDRRPILAVLLVIFGIGYLALVWERTGIASPGEVRFALNDGALFVGALFFLPSIAMAIVLFLAAWRLARSRV